MASWLYSIVNALKRLQITNAYPVNSDFCASIVENILTLAVPLIFDGNTNVNSALFDISRFGLQNFLKSIIFVR